MDQILLAVERGAELAFRLLAFAGREVFQPRALNVKTVVDEVAALLERSLGEHVQLVVNVAADTWPILFDPGLLEQVLLIWPSTPVMPSPAGARSPLTPRTSLETRGRGNHVRIRVVDDGVGMTTDTLHRVFEPFFTTKPLGEGTGMGLAPRPTGWFHGCRRDHRDRVRAGSTALTVTIVMPAGDGAVREEGVVTVPGAADPRALGAKVLLVEEDDDVPPRGHTEGCS